MSATPAAPREPARPRPAVEAALVAVLLALLLAQLGYGAWSDGVTYDEREYLSRGYRHLVLGDQRLGAEHPPLANVLAAAPMLALPVQARPLRPDELVHWWDWSRDFLFVDNAGLPLVAWARATVVAQSLALALLVWAWSRALFGPWAAGFALALWTFHPSLLAHGHLATTDLPGTATTVLSSWALWRWSQRPAWSRAALFGLAFGLAAATRLTIFLLVPVFLVLALLPLEPGSGPRRPRQLATLAAWSAGLAWLVVWAAYGFHFRPWPGESPGPVVPAEWLTALDGLAGRLLATLRSWRLLPAGYVTALEAHVVKVVVGNEGYLLGRLGTSGWPHYYVVALLAKSTPGFLLLAALGLARALQALGATARLLAHFWLPAAAFLVSASLSKVQVGERYVLPVHVYLVLLAAGALRFLLERAGGPAVLAVALGLHAGSGLLAARHGYLAYFSPLVGGLDSAHLVLADSNLDWGQDLPRLAAWMRRHGVARVGLSYFGADLPSRYGIDCELLPGLGQPPPRVEDLRGVVAVSPTRLVGLFQSPAERAFHAALRRREPDDRAGALLIYRFPEGPPPAPAGQD